VGENVTVLITEQEIKKRIAVIAAQISKDYAGEDVCLVCLLKGAVIFMCDLARALDLPSVEFDFMDVSSYSGTTSTGIIKINKDLSDSVEGKHVILVEDIVDTGLTISKVIEFLTHQQNPKSIKICTLLDKPARRDVNRFNIDYAGFVIPDEFVVGYGLDYEQRYRNLPYIGVLNFS
jgi:hypoxanthine phosphoribosyltransferase